MESEAPIPLEDNVNVVKKKSVGRSSPTKKNTGKVPKKIHKAEREKLKRDHMNLLFLELGNALEPECQNNGKSSTLSDTIRLLRDLLAQVDCLKRENATLFSESQYVSIEKNELKEENSALEGQIRKLQIEIEKRVHAQSLWRLDPFQSQNNTTTLQSTDLGPVFVVPLHDDPKLYPNPNTAEAVPKLPSNVRRPHARYPSPSDSWPSHLLSDQPKADQNSHHDSTSTSSSTSSRDERGFSNQ